MAVAGEVDELEVRVLPVEVRDVRKGTEGLPVPIVGSLIEAGHGRAQLDEIELAVTGEVEQLPGAAVETAIGPRGKGLDRTQAGG